ncbi:U3 snoRNP-associated protein-like EMB2271 [Silene latifolia]|uniref:U3 snoRNP-associated protein-like EMB2271 n=1 Tax=Silene latifolia TaxID=37657 RepID=UPI003D7738D5
MKGRTLKRKPTNPTNKKGKKIHEKNPKKRKNNEEKDEFFLNEEEIKSSSDEDDDIGINGGFSDDEKKGNNSSSDDDDEDEEETETVEQTKRRLTLKVLENVRKMEREKEEDEFVGVEDREERDGARDSIVKNRLLQQQLEDSGRSRRFIASKVQQPEADAEPRLLYKHRQSVTAVALSDDDSRGFSASKDGCVVHWDVETGKAEKYLWPSDDVLKSHGLRDPHGLGKKHSKQVLALAASSDGRYLATGGVDRHIHLWDTRAREHIKAFSGHKKLVSCLAFREGTSELFSGSYDKEPKIWNAEDRTYIGSLQGHHSEVLSISCLRKERALTAGRDRQMCYWKVPEESHLVFRSSASSLESCCLVSNDEFLSGSDDGSIQLWSVLRKKPVCIFKNAHSLTTAKKIVDLDDDEVISNGHPEDELNEVHTPSLTARSWVGAVSVCRNSDFAASGAGNGFVRLWAIESEARGIRPLFSVPVVGYVNSLAIAKSGRFLVAGVGQEPRLGRWGTISAARNGVILQPFKLSP